MFADMHIHSQYSDGTLNIQEIVKKAKAQNISLISVCDHNTIEAYQKEGDFCAKSGIKLITGVEIQAVMDDKEHHILAYSFNIENTALPELLEYNRSILNEMGKRLIQNMSKDHKSLSPDEFSKHKRDPKNGGWDGLDYLKSKGLARDWTDYFTYAKQYNITLDRKFKHPADVIKIIHNAKGYAILAHPGEGIAHSIQKCKETALKFLPLGIDGFECYYPSHTNEATEAFLNLCREHDLIVTAGSDDHGGFNNIPGGCEYDMSTGKVAIGLIKKLCPYPANKQIKGE